MRDIPPDYYDNEIRNQIRNFSCELFQLRKNMNKELSIIKNRIGIENNKELTNQISSKAQIKIRRYRNDK